MRREEFSISKKAAELRLQVRTRRALGKWLTEGFVHSSFNPRHIYTFRPMVRRERFDCRKNVFDTTKK